MNHVILSLKSYKTNFMNVNQFDKNLPINHQKQLQTYFHICWIQLFLKLEYMAKLKYRMHCPPFLGLDY